MASAALCGWPATGSSARIFVARVQMKVRLVWLRRRYNTLFQAYLAAQPGEAGALAAK